MCKRYASETGTCYGCAYCKVGTTSESYFENADPWDHDAFAEAIAEYQSLPWWKRLTTSMPERYEFKRDLVTKTREVYAISCYSTGSERRMRTWRDGRTYDDIDEFNDYPHQCEHYFPDHLTRGE